MKKLNIAPVRKNEMMKVMLMSSLLSLLLLLFRIFFTGNVSFIFLGWNLFLAWLPLIFASFLSEIRSYSSKRWPPIFVFGAWLVFFPNSPYIITDLFHLWKRPGMPLWFDLFLLISFAWNGLLLGFISLLAVQEWLNQNFKKSRSWAFVVLLMFLCGYGVYLGRFERWNSWDVLTHGKDLFGNIFAELVHPLSNPRMLGVTLVFGTFLLLGYLTLRALTNIRGDEK